MSYTPLSPEALTVAVALDRLRAENPGWNLGQAMDHLRSGSATPEDMDMALRIAKWLVQVAPLFPEEEVKVGIVVTCQQAVLGGVRKTSLAAAKIALNPGGMVADMASQALPSLMQGWPTFIQMADMPQMVQEALARPIGSEN